MWICVGAAPGCAEGRHRHTALPLDAEVLGLLSACISVGCRLFAERGAPLTYSFWGFRVYGARVRVRVLGWGAPLTYSFWGFRVYGARARVRVRVLGWGAPLTYSFWGFRVYGARVRVRVRVLGCRFGVLGKRRLGLLACSTTVYYQYPLEEEPASRREL